MRPCLRQASILLFALFAAAFAFAQPPSITLQPASATVLAGDTVSFWVQVAGNRITLPLHSFRWRKNGGTDLRGTGQTTGQLTIPSVTAGDAGQYWVEVSNPDGSVTSQVATLRIAPPEEAGRLANVSVRVDVGLSDEAPIIGFIISGSTMKPVQIRGIGPTLASFGVSGVLADPVLSLYRGSTAIASNDDWTLPAPLAGAFPLPSGSRDALIASDGLPAGSYSVRLAGKADATGISLVEVYDGTPTAEFGVQTSKLTNLSARAPLGIGERSLILGFSVGGATETKLLIRAIGPGLKAFGVASAVSMTGIILFDASNNRLGYAQGGGSLDSELSSAAIGAFPLANGDSAVSTWFAPGNYTVQVFGTETVGLGLIEIYQLPRTPKR